MALINRRGLKNPEVASQNALRELGITSRYFNGL